MDLSGNGHETTKKNCWFCSLSRTKSIKSILFAMTICMNWNACSSHVWTNERLLLLDVTIFFFLFKLIQFSWECAVEWYWLSPIQWIHWKRAKKPQEWIEYFLLKLGLHAEELSKNQKIKRRRKTEKNFLWSFWKVEKMCTKEYVRVCLKNTRGI